MKIHKAMNCWCGAKHTHKGTPTPAPKQPAVNPYKDTCTHGVALTLTCQECYKQPSKPFCGYDIADGELCRDTRLNKAGHCKKHAPEYEPSNPAQESFDQQRKRQLAQFDKEEIRRSTHTPEAIKSLREIWMDWDTNYTVGGNTLITLLNTLDEVHEAYASLKQMNGELVAAGKEAMSMMLRNTLQDHKDTAVYHRLKEAISRAEGLTK